MDRITANIENLMKQAPMTVDVYLSSAKESIDTTFGDGYSAQHPELVSAYLQACSTDLATACIASCLQEIADACAD